MEPKNAIEVRNMSKSFRIESDGANTLKEKILFWSRNKAEVHQVLKNINLNIKPGETVALIGTNGSGKSTLLKLMSRIIFPNEGTVQTFGKVTSLLELGAGFHQDFTGRENIYFNASIFGLTHKEIDQRIQQIIDFSELGEFIDTPIRTYSSGMYMRLAFSVAINVDADILLIDEILAVGDQHFQDKCYAKLDELKASGKTIVIVSHSLGVVRDLCHRAIWIYHGELRLDGDPAYVIDEYLKQSAIDHKEKVKKEKESGSFRTRAILFIDSPRDLARIDADRDQILLCGWLVSNDEEAKLNVYLNDELLEDVDRTKRQDVFDAYMESFEGYLDVDHLGWEKHISTTELSKGKHHLKVTCTDVNNNVLAGKEVEFTLE